MRTGRVVGFGARGRTRAVAEEGYALTRFEPLANSRASLSLRATPSSATARVLPHGFVQGRASSLTLAVRPARSLRPVGRPNQRGRRSGRVDGLTSRLGRARAPGTR